MSDSNRNSVFTQRLQEKFKSSRLSQAELARRSGLSKSTISHYLKGDWKGKQDAVYAIATALNCNAEWLLGYDDREQNVSAKSVEENVDQLLLALGYTFEYGDYGSKYYMSKYGAEIIPEYSVEMGLHGGRIDPNDKDVLVTQIIAQVRLLADKLLVKGMEFELRKKIESLDAAATAANDIGNLQAYSDALALKDHTREMLMHLLGITSNAPK